MKTTLTLILFILGSLHAQAQFSKVDAFIRTLAKNKEGIQVLRFDTSNIKALKKSTDTHFLLDVNPFLPNRYSFATIR